jgi:hypothetical protein
VGQLVAQRSAIFEIWPIGAKMVRAVNKILWRPQLWADLDEFKFGDGR